MDPVHFQSLNRDTWGELLKEGCDSGLEVDNFLGYYPYVNVRASRSVLKVLQAGLKCQVYFTQDLQFLRMIA